MSSEDLLRLEYIPLSQAALWDRNPKNHDIGLLSESIRLYGFKDPPKVEPELNDGNGGIVEGNGRIITLRMMFNQGMNRPRGITEIEGTGEWAVPMLFGVDAASEAMAQAYAISHNNLVLAGADGVTAWDMARLWDDEGYLEVLKGLAEADLLPVSVDLEDFSDLMASLDFEEPPEDPGVDISKGHVLAEEYGTAVGQIWSCGVHRLAIGDCRDGALIQALVGKDKVEAVVTDPPYGIEREGILNDDPEGLRALYDGCLAAMPIDNAVVIAFQSPRLFWMWLDAVRDAGHKVERALWSYKPNGIRYPWRGWIMKSDMLVVSTMGQPSWPVNVPDCHDCYQYTHEYELAESGGWHGSVKPSEVVESLVAHTSGVVYDPFLGSGTTLIACQRLGRKCLGVELLPLYAAISLKRWEDLTGEKVVRLTSLSGQDNHRGSV